MQEQQHDYFVDGLLGNIGSSACFGNKACQKQRTLDLQNQQLNQAIIARELDKEDDGSFSTTAIVLLILLVLVILAILGFFIFKRLKKK